MGMGNSSMAEQAESAQRILWRIGAGSDKRAAIKRYSSDDGADPLDAVIGAVGMAVDDPRRVRDIAIALLDLQCDADRDSEREYSESIDAMAAEILDEIMSYGGTDVGGMIWERAGGSYWAIYYHAAAKALQHSDNENAIFDSGMDAGAYDSVGAFQCAAAAFAVEADIRHAFWGLVSDMSDRLNAAFDGLDVDLDPEDPGDWASEIDAAAGGFFEALTALIRADF